MDVAKRVALDALKHCVSDHVDVGADGMVVLEIIPPDMVDLHTMIRLCNTIKEHTSGVTLCINEENVIVRLHPKEDRFIRKIEEYNSKLEASRAEISCDNMPVETLGGALMYPTPDIQTIVLRLKKQIPSIETDIRMKFVDKETIQIRVPIIQHASLHMNAMKAVLGFTRIKSVKFGTTKHKSTTLLCLFVYVNYEIMQTSRKRSHAHMSS